MKRFLICFTMASLALGAPASAQEMALDSVDVPTSGEIVELAIPSAPGVVIAGTLRLPKERGEGPFPLVISMSGDGPNPRGGYHLLSERLLAEGIATFEYDKRGSGASAGTFAPLLTEAAEDGVRCSNICTPTRVSIRPGSR
ncbi:alpha/beta hydrolase family protein [Alteriqipengyuania sp. 357]